MSTTRIRLATVASALFFLSAFNPSNAQAPQTPPAIESPAELSIRLATEVETLKTLVAELTTRIAALEAQLAHGAHAVSGNPANVGEATPHSSDHATRQEMSADLALRYLQAGDAQRLDRLAWLRERLTQIRTHMEAAQRGEIGSVGTYRTVTIAGGQYRREGNNETPSYLFSSAADRSALLRDMQADRQAIADELTVTQRGESVRPQLFVDDLTMGAVGHIAPSRQIAGPYRPNGTDQTPFRVERVLDDGTLVASIPLTSATNRVTVYMTGVDTDELVSRQEIDLIGRCFEVAGTETYRPSISTPARTVFVLRVVAP